MSRIMLQLHLKFALMLRALNSRKFEIEIFNFGLQCFKWYDKSLSLSQMVGCIHDANDFLNYRFIYLFEYYNTMHKEIWKPNE